MLPHKMTSVTLKMRSNSPDLNSVFILPWCFIVLNLVRIRLEILKENHLTCCRLKWPQWPGKWGQGHQVRIWSRFELVRQCTEFGENTWNFSWDIERKPSFMSLPWMVSVTLKIRSRSLISNLVFILPWCSCVPYLVRISQIFLEILCRNHISCRHLEWLLCDLENEVKVTSFKLGLHLAMVLQCTAFGEDTSHISWDIARIPYFMSSPLMTSVTLKMSSRSLFQNWSSSCPGASVY